MFRLLVIFLLAFLCGCAPKGPPPTIYPAPEKLPATQRPYRVNGRAYYPLPTAKGYVEVGWASWYGPKFHGRLTASGERYNMYAFTAAHKLLPMNTYVLVTNLENGRQVVVRINDRGPFVKNRIIDLSYAAARALGMAEKGVARVRIVVLAEGHLEKHHLVFKDLPDFQKGQFYLQVGAFTNYANALRFQKRLAEEFRRVRIKRYKKDGRTFYRVQIFLATDLDKARARARSLSTRFPGAFLVAE